VKRRRRGSVTLRRDCARTIEELEKAIAAGDVARGAQVCAKVEGETVLEIARGAAGDGNPMRGDTIVKVYCAIKPVTAVAVAAHVDSGRLSLDEPAGKLLPAVAALTDGAITVRHLLNHTAGLHEPYAVHMELLPSHKRDAFVDAMRLPDGWRIGRDAGYSEFVGWHLLGRLLEAVSRRPLRDELRATVLDPLGMSDTWIGMSEQQYDENVARIGMNHDMRGWVVFPQLLERARRVCRETNPAYGGYTTASDLARFYAALVTQLKGVGNPCLPSDATLRTFCSSARERSYDVILERECTHGLGFMTGLADHQFGPCCSPASFGHSGWSGTTFAFADPNHELAVAVVLNGIARSKRAFAARSALVDAIYSDLGLAPVT
jgi:CubicO group peptidase (beta-lactamase class C family)